jgi:2-methylcitrate dehydratase PrpD
MEVTRTFAAFASGLTLSAIPETVRHEATRALLNWLGCALGGARDEAVDRMIAALEPFFGAPVAAIPGRTERADVAHAALLTGYASNILDFDDTHLATVIHPTVPVASALLPLAEARGASGADFLAALVAGIEIACKVGLAVSPRHYQQGWHISGTCGVLGAAAACARLLHLDTRRTAWAIGIAATQASGLIEMLGGMAKSFNLGHAARSGLTAALLAEQGFDSSERALEAPRGFAAVLSGGDDFGPAVASLGQSWETLQNAYKPFPCGIVLHPTIDGCLQLVAEHAVKPQHVEAIELVVHPLTLQLTDRADPKTGLESKLSVQHGAAVALFDGEAGPLQFSDSHARHPEIVALRAKVATRGDDTLRKDEAIVAVTARGKRHVRHVRTAIGSLDRPLSDDDLESKLRDLAGGVLETGQAEKLIALTWSVATLGDAGVLARAAVPLPDES